MMSRELPIPRHFDPDRVGEIWRVPYRERARQAEAWAERHGVRAAREDATRICLLAVDCQNTFCLPDFELFVAGRSGMGAVEDTSRLCEFVYRNLGRLTWIVPTMDTHTAMQIFHPVFWVDEEGRHPAGGTTIISAEDIERGVWRVNPELAASIGDGDPDYLARHALHYARSLEQESKYPLLVWPYHSMLGGIGHALVSALEEALFFHCIARRSQTGFDPKGGNPLTEHYSALRPEVLRGPDGKRIASPNPDLVDRLLGFDALIVAGQAKSHCVAWTVQDLLTDIRERDPALVEKVYLLEDCTSPVVIPDGPDFTDQADAAFQRFADAGMHLVRSTDPLDGWPALRAE
jgi:nicotinamidase-related amidase